MSKAKNGNHKGISHQSDHYDLCSNLWSQQNEALASAHTVAGSSMAIENRITLLQHFVVKVSIPQISPSDLFSVLINCRCTNSFISCDLVNQHSLPRKSLPKHLKITLFDRSFSGYITHSIDITFEFENKISDSWTFLQMKLSPNCQFALGLNWLRSQNPTIDWTLRMFAFDPYIEPSLELSEPLGIPFTKYPVDMFTRKSKDSLATFAKSLENFSDMNSKDHNLQIPAPGE
jgi:Retroviral aspartyl protease